MSNVLFHGLEPSHLFLKALHGARSPARAGTQTNSARNHVTLLKIRQLTPKRQISTPSNQRCLPKSVQGCGIHHAIFSGFSAGHQTPRTPSGIKSWSALGLANPPGVLDSCPRECSSKAHASSFVAARRLLLRSIELTSTFADLRAQQPVPTSFVPASKLNDGTVIADPSSRWCTCACPHMRTVHAPLLLAS